MATSNRSSWARRVCSLIQLSASSRVIEFGLVGVDDQDVPVLADQRDPPTRDEDPAGFGQGRVRVG
jgi:hypothetical protein